MAEANITQVLRGEPFGLLRTFTLRSNKEDGPPWHYSPNLNLDLLMEKWSAVDQRRKEFQTHLTYLRRFQQEFFDKLVRERGTLDIEGYIEDCIERLSSTPYDLGQVEEIGRDNLRSMMTDAIDYLITEGRLKGSLLYGRRIYVSKEKIQEVKDRIMTYLNHYNLGSLSLKELPHLADELGNGIEEVTVAIQMLEREERCMRVKDGFIFHEIKQSVPGIKIEKVVTGDSVEAGGSKVDIRDSVVMRSRIASSPEITASCPNCGTKLEPLVHAKLCPNCGHRLES